MTSLKNQVIQASARVDLSKLEVESESQGGERPPLSEDMLRAEQRWKECA